MPFAVARQNAAVDAVTGGITHIALLDESLTEITGGSPAYARQAVAWDASASAIGDNTDAETFNVPAGTTVAFLGFESNVSTNDGKTQGWWPLGGQPLMAGVVEGDDDTITSKAHGLTASQRVVFMDITGGGLPTGLTEGVVYWVRSAGLATDSFTVATTDGGAAVNITTDGEVFFTRCIPETFASQGTYTIAAGDLDVIGNLV
jgi:hypothetical protein